MSMFMSLPEMGGGEAKRRKVGLDDEQNDGWSEATAAYRAPL